MILQKFSHALASSTRLRITSRHMTLKIQYLPLVGLAAALVVLNTSERTIYEKYATIFSFLAITT